MARVVERNALTPKERIQWLERDADDIESALHKEIADLRRDFNKEMADLREDINRIDRKQDRLMTVMTSLLVAVIAAMVTVSLSSFYK